MKILTFSTLFPNAAAPSHGVFVENRMRDFKRRYEVDLRVIAPVPWFPFKSQIFAPYDRFANAPAQETRHGIDVHHPRYFLPPKIGMTYAPTGLARCLNRGLDDLAQQGWEPDLIDAHYLYPDSVAAARVAHERNIPLVLTARGSDVSLLATYPTQRQMIIEAVRQADATVCVADALRTGLIELGAPFDRLHVLRNGVDLDLFHSGANTDLRSSDRQTLSLENPTLLSVGHLIERKGHDLVIQALATLPEFDLVIVGEGPELARLKALSSELGVTQRVTFAGQQRHDMLPTFYRAADALVLASSREGWPNVLLEAMACGTPVVATDVWGSGEVIGSPVAGRLSKERTPECIAAAIKDLFENPPERAETRAYAEGFSWAETSAGLKHLFSKAVAKGTTVGRIKQLPLTIPDGPPRLIVTVDTEEIFDWHTFDEKNHKIARPSDLNGFQDLCEAKGIKPLYFLTYPLIQDDDTRSYFKDLHTAGAADLGLHLHQWKTPPGTDHLGPYYSWQSNLPAEAHQAKLKTLQRNFRDAFGFNAHSHRAGRYGISPEAYGQLAAVGVTMDFSPSPGFDFSAHGGPDFTMMSNEPFSVCSPGQLPVWVTPACGKRALKGGNIFLSQSSVAGFQQHPAPNFSGLTASLRLTCEQASLNDLKRLTRKLVARRVPVLTFSFHSTSMTLGGNPYAEDREAVSGMLSLMDDYFQFFKNEIGGDVIDLHGLQRLYDSQDSANTAA
ncbi:MAG: glycosyltransferase [Pseudomonadota bacterium]